MAQANNEPDGLNAPDALWRPLRRLGEFRHAVWLLVAVNALFLLGPDWVERFQAPRNWLPDFFQEYASARNYWEGRPIYLDHVVTMPLYLSSPPPLRSVVIRINAHPPTSVLLSLPFAALEFPRAFLVWNFLSVAGLAAGLALIARQLRWRLGLGAILATLALLTLCAPLREQVRQGQWNGLLMLLLTGAWAAERNDRQRPAGVLIGLAAAIKLFPAFLLLLFAWRGRWRVVLWGLIALAGATLATAAVLGAGAYVEYFGNVLPQIDWFRILWNNASAPGFFSKLFDPMPYRPLNYWWKTEPLWPSPMAMGLGEAMTAFVLIGMVGLAALRTRGRSDEDLPARDRAFALALVAMVLLSPVAWEHYFVMLALPLALVWRDVPRAGALGVKALFLTIVALLWTSPREFFEALGVFGGHTATPTQVLAVLSYQFYALLALFGLLWTAQTRGLGAPRALGGPRVWLAAGSCLALALFVHKTWTTFLARGLFDWIGLDYAIYASNARAVLAHGPSVFYHQAAIDEQIRAFLPYYGTHADSFKSGPSPYPVPFIAPFLLLARLGPVAGFAAWALFNVGLVVAIVRGTIERTPDARRGIAFAFALVFAALAYLPVAYDLFMGQLVIVMAYGLYRAYRAFERGEDFRAGCWLGALLIKPQFAILPALVLLGKQRWRSLGGLAATGAALALATLAAVGPDGVRDYVQILRDFSGFREVPSIVYPQDMINVRGVLVNVLPADWGERAGAALALAISAVWALALVPVWRGRWAPRSRRFALQWLALLVATVATAHHSHIHAAALLIVPALALLARKRAPGWARALSIAAVLVPTYLFCVTGVPRSAGWALLALMAAAQFGAAFHAVRARARAAARTPVAARPSAVFSPQSS